VTQPAKSTDRLATRILYGLVIGLVLGLVARALCVWQPGLTKPILWLTVAVLDPFGQVFLRLLFFVVVPLVFGSLALGVVQLGRLDRLGPLAARTFILFAINMAIGVALGLLLMNLVKPGGHISEQSRARLLAEFGDRAQAIHSAANAQKGFSLNTVVEMFMPRNLLKDVVEFQLLPLILFALLVGAAGTQLKEEHRLQLQNGLEIIVELMTRIVHYALTLAPYAVPALIFSVVIKFGMDFLQSLFLFVATVLVGLLIHLFGTMSLLLKLLTKRSPREFFRAIRAILVTAFSTSSSNATLPTSIQVTRENLGVSASTAGFVLPLGATMNMSGTSLYEGCVVLFIAQVYGIDLSLGQQITLLCLAVLSAVAVAGIPGGSLPLIVGLLATFGIPPEGIALILGTDRLLDMARTVLNVAADVVTACIVDERVKPSAHSQETLSAISGKTGGLK
jgi:DAACS family dicarboxylate/amino acid:cation (Na+ or H+) symporter